LSLTSFRFYQIEHAGVFGIARTHPYRCTGLTKPAELGFLAFPIACASSRFVATVSASKHCFRCDTGLRETAMIDNRYIRPLLGCTDKMEELRAEVEKVAATNLTVMIRGERGTGKDVVAQNIHMHSDRRTAPSSR
jgi:DNA-binding NtrC family response regulator